MNRAFNWLSSRLITTVMIAAIMSFSATLALAARSEPDPQVPPPPSHTEQEREALFQPGDPWIGQGRQGLSQKEAEQFSDYPTYWLGEEFAGYNLQAIIREDYQPEPPIPAYEAMDSLGFGYGDCVIPEGASACSVPVLIKTEPLCLTRPETVAPVAKASELETTGGDAQMLRFADGHVRLWTGDVSIYLSASADYDLTTQIIADLEGFNTDLSASEDLPAPNFSSCPPPDERLKTHPPS